MPTADWLFKFGHIVLANADGDITFSIGESGDDRYLYASGGDASGPGTVIIMMQGVSAGGWSLATS